MGKTTAVFFTLAWLLFAVAMDKDVAAADVDRTTVYIPLAANHAPNARLIAVQHPAEALGDSQNAGWNAYLRVWQSHHADPSATPIRRMLGLPLGDAPTWSAKRSRSAPTWLGWRPGTYAEVETPHFVIYSQAGKSDSAAVAKDLERCYWAWTQMFFPIWEASDQVTVMLKQLKPDQSVASYLDEHPSRLSTKRKLRIVLFRDASEYARVLSRDVPGIERSTGFYSDVRKTMFLYASENDDAATRRHELVHQLFREATRSGLGRSMPGEQSGFWLVEGIAGYFESLFVGDTFATVGGWDSPRLQFGRYRTLVGGDQMSIDELQIDGRLAAQKRGDIARWYAHAITQTHRLMDDGNASDRIWVYQQLANLYDVKAKLPDAKSPNPSGDENTRAFLAIDDETLIDNAPVRSLESLCLAGCQVTEKGIASIGVQPELTWLDLARLPIGNDAVRGIAASPRKIEQLTLEATQVDSDLTDWIGNAVNLRELDLSWTRTDDRVIAAIEPAKKLSVLWMTGTQITDESIPQISAMQELKSVDVQRTNVTASGIESLRKATSADINPLELRTATP
ncbi:leucine-rich repeat domain-containing protein [Rubripirellula reticaptiva]|uniref:Leucine Rich repeats (2 copies) n=1 Tax=Rubripirellula reticaptiva TaxID=2528013 RepID=A0A5C6EN70_9BACT|nr:hypothetical protein [Rubripirellula reticaptiva]TWU49537.1 Leucine Rich repeats (2 copies) [Rubripirellula reticaptiva]